LVGISSLLKNKSSIWPASIWNLCRRVKLHRWRQKELGLRGGRFIGHLIDWPCSLPFLTPERISASYHLDICRTSQCATQYHAGNAINLYLLRLSFILTPHILLHIAICNPASDSRCASNTLALVFITFSSYIH
jgi:hypothetical protein